MLYRVNNIRTLEIFYQELLSLSPEWRNFQEFKAFFVELTRASVENGRVRKSFQALGLDLSSGLVDCDIRAAFRFSDPEHKNTQKSDSRPNVRSGDTRTDPGTAASGPARGSQKIIFEEKEEAGDAA